MKRTIMVKEVWPIYINSKSRPECETLKLLPKRAKIVIEPQDFDAYAEIHPKSRLIVMPYNDQGIAYARDFTLRLATQNNVGWLWLMDDDIKGFYKQVNGKNIKCDFEEVETYVMKKLRGQEKFAQASLEYQQYAWSCGGKVTINSYADVCVLINVKKTNEIGAHYDLSFKLKSDRDFTLQLLTMGSNNVRFTKYSFSAPENGSNKGGLKSVYDKKSPERLSAIKLEEKWGNDIVNVQVKKSGRVDAKINWRYFKRK